MQSPCVTFLDMDIYQQARNGFPSLQCVVLVWLSWQQLAYICAGGGGARSVRRAEKQRKRPGAVYSTEILLHLLKLVPKTSRFKRIHNAPTDEGLHNLSSERHSNSRSRWVSYSPLTREMILTPTKILTNPCLFLWITLYIPQINMDSLTIMRWNSYLLRLPAQSIH
jgi:hypothetical protein